MFTTLEALHRAVIASPEDRTVRLAYADALDETGEKANVIRAEFIRSQIELDSLDDSDSRYANLRFRCRELFESHWVDWWHPVCEAARLPSPFVPSRRRRTRILQAVSLGADPPGFPYFLDATETTTINHTSSGMSIRFACGFPEEVRFRNMDGPEFIHQWGSMMPLARLAISHMITPIEWERIDGVHLTRLPELTFDRLLSNTTMLVASSPYLRPLTRLRVNPVGANADTIDFLVRSPTWAELRSLHFTGRLTPGAVRDLATHCTLAHLEELDLVLGNPNILAGAVAAALNVVVRSFMQTLSFDTTPPVRWADYGPALETLAATPWVRKLRRLRIASDIPSGLLGMLGERLYGSAERGADLLPDESIFALVNALNPETLERLELPGAIIGPSVKEELMTRLGDRIAFG